MKGKILIVGGLLAFISIYYAADFVKCPFGGEDGNGNIVSEERNVTAFDKVKVKQGLEMVLIPSEEERVVVVADSNLLDNIAVEVVDGELIASISYSIRKSSEMKIEVYFDDLASISISSGAVLSTDGFVESDSLEINASAGAEGEIANHTTYLSVGVSAGSSLYLIGESNNFLCEASSGSSVEAFDLLAGRAAAISSSGSSIEVSVVDALDAKASSGGSIEYKGDSLDLSRTVSSGGEVALY